MGLIYSPLLTVGTKDTTADVTDVTDVTDPTVSFDQLTPPDPTKRDWEQM